MQWKDSATNQEAADSTEDSEVILGQERCIKQNALNAVKNVKFLLNQQKESQFIVKTVTIRKDLDFS